jgi:nitroreductase
LCGARILALHPTGFSQGVSKMTKIQIELISPPVRKQLSDEEMVIAATQQLQLMRERRTIREFSDQPVPREVIENCLLIAGSAPSGANLQPWHFAVISDPEIKRQIREAAEAEEREFYQHRAPPEWLEALAPLGTDEHKPFLETAPYLIVIFAKSYDQLSDGRAVKNYYVSESVGIATGFLIRALHQCGLATLTHTPSPMGFLNTILQRPKNERPMILLVVGHAAATAKVPRINKKPLGEIASFH